MIDNLRIIATIIAILLTFFQGCKNSTDSENSEDRKSNSYTTKKKEKSPNVENDKSSSNQNQEKTSQISDDNNSKNISVKERGEFTGNFSVYDTDFSKYDGKITEDAARQILRLVTEDYKNSNLNLNDDVFKVWNNIDKVHSGGKYHGRIILKIFKLYLNKAFSRFHSEEFVTKHYGKEKYSNDFRKIDIQVSETNDSYEYTMNLSYWVKAFPEFTVSLKDPYIHGTLSGSYYRKESMYEARKEAMSDFENYINKDKFISESVAHSSNQVEDLLEHISKTVRKSDYIYKHEKLDKVLLRIINKFGKTKSKYGEEVAKKLYSKLGEVIIKHINKDSNKKEFLKKCNGLGISVEHDENSQNYF